MLPTTRKAEGVRNGARNEDIPQWCCLTHHPPSPTSLRTSSLHTTHALGTHTPSLSALRRFSPLARACMCMCVCVCVWGFWVRRCAAAAFFLPAPNDRRGAAHRACDEIPRGPQPAYPLKGGRGRRETGTEVESGKNGTRKKGGEGRAVLAAVVRPYRTATPSQVHTHAHTSAQTYILCYGHQEIYAQTRTRVHTCGRTRPGKQ